MTYTTVRFGLYEKISSKLLEGRDGTTRILLIIERNAMFFLRILSLMFFDMISYLA